MNSAASSILNRQEKDPSILSPAQAQVDDLVNGFEGKATEWEALAAMTAGGLAYRAARIGVMGWGSASTLRTVSVGLGLTAEVSTFELAHRALVSNPQSNQNLWSWNGSGGIRQGLLQSFIAFGALKGAGRLAQGENFIAQHLFQDSAMVLGHQVTGAIGITPRPTGSLAEQFLHAEATTLQIGAGMALAHGFAPGLGSLERGLDVFTSEGRAFGFSFDPQVLTGPRPVRATPMGGGALLSGENPRPFSPILAMTASQGRDSSPSLSQEGSGASGERERTQHPALDLFLQVIEKAGSNPEAAQAMIPREEWDILTRLRGSALVPRGWEGRNALLHQALSGVTGVRGGFEAVKGALGDIHYLGRLYAAAGSNKYAVVFSVLEYLREERPHDSLWGLLALSDEKLGEDLAEARNDMRTALSALGQLYRTLTETEDGAFLRAAFIGGSEFGTRGIRFHYRKFENEILKVLPPEFLAEADLQSVLSYEDLVRKTWKLTHTNQQEK